MISFVIYTQKLSLKPTSRLRALVNPPHIPKLPTERILKYLLHTIIRLVLLLRQHLRNIRRQPPSLIPAGSKITILSHESVIIRPRIGRSPDDVPAALDRVVQIRVREDAAVLRVPGAAERALAGDGEGGVCFLDDAVVDVDAVRVREGGVGAFPRGDAAAAGAEGEEG